MKTIFFLLFILSIPNSYALAVSPPKLEFNLHSNDFEEQEFYIYNNNDEKVNYSIVSSDWFRFYPSNFLEIGPRSSKMVKAILETNNAEKGKYESKIYIKESLNNKGINFENGLAIKTHINVLSGESKKEKQEDIKIIKISDIKEKEAKGKIRHKAKKAMDNHFFTLLAIVLILAIANLIKKLK